MQKPPAAKKSCRKRKMTTSKTGSKHAKIEEVLEPEEIQPCFQSLPLHVCIRIADSLTLADQSSLAISCQIGRMAVNSVWRREFTLRFCPKTMRNLLGENKSEDHYQYIHMYTKQVTVKEKPNEIDYSLSNCVLVIISLKHDVFSSVNDCCLEKSQLFKLPPTYSRILAAKLSFLLRRIQIGRLIGIVCEGLRVFSWDDLEKAITLSELEPADILRNVRILDFRKCVVRERCLKKMAIYTPNVTEIFLNDALIGMEPLRSDVNGNGDSNLVVLNRGGQSAPVNETSEMLELLCKIRNLSTLEDSGLFSMERRQMAVQMKKMFPKLQKLHCVPRKNIDNY